MSDNNKAAIDAIVKNYLISRGYEKAAAEMEMQQNQTANTSTDNTHEKGNNDMIIAHTNSNKNGSSSNIDSSTNMSTSSSISSTLNNSKTDAQKKKDLLSFSTQILSTVTEDIIILGLNNGNYRVYEEEYSSLRSWALTSLDLIKNEVSLILFPVFVHW